MGIVLQLVQSAIANLGFELPIMINLTWVKTYSGSYFVYVFQFGVAGYLQIVQHGILQLYLLFNILR